jgi:hypothetical protein
VLDDAGFGRAHVVRHDNQRRRECRDVAQAVDRGNRPLGVVRSRADDELRAALVAHRRTTSDDGLLLVGLE